LFENVIGVPRERGYTPGRVFKGLAGPLPLPVLNYFAPAVLDRFKNLLRTGSFDAVQLESVHLITYLDGIGTAKRRPKLLVDWHNIESELMSRYAEQAPPLRKLVAHRTSNLLARTERKLLGTGEAHTVVSEREKQTLLQIEPAARVYVIPNGVDTSAFPKATSTAADANKRTLLFVGSMDYHANIDAVTWFVRGPWVELARRFPFLHFTIAGRQPSPAVQALASGRVHVTGTVGDLAAVYSEAFAVIVPLRVGGGTRLKILEAMAAGVPVISTRLGAEGIDARDGVHLMVADTAEQMLSALSALLSDEQLRASLIRDARRLVEQEYDWRILGQRLARIYTDVLFSEGTSPSAER
jgi:glycosyltransferase involved in cell wall biosynthesis